MSHRICSMCHILTLPICNYQKTGRGPRRYILPAQLKFSKIMFPKLKISSFLLKRLERVKQQCSGCLFGVVYEGTLLLLGFNVETTIGKLNYKQIQYKFPAEVDLCGMVKFGDCTDAEAHLNEIIQDVDITDNPILLNCVLGTLVDLKASVFMHGKLQDIPYEIVDEAELYTDLSFSRLRCNLSLYTEENSEIIRQDMQKLRKKLAGGCLAFHISNTVVYLTGSQTGTTTTLPPNTKISDLLNMANNTKNESFKSKKNQKPLPPADYEIMNVQVMRAKTKESSTLSAIRSEIKQNDMKVCIPLEIDAIAMLYRNTKILGLYDILIESICRSLRLIEQSLIDCVKRGDPLKIPRTYHFSVPDFGHFLSCVYLDDYPEDNPYLLQKRKKLHHHFGLPITRPYFRKANRHIFKEELVNSPLVNPHIGLKPSGIKDGTQYLVQGKYSYYHYMQQNFDDNGWGCAYRSLQTLISWFRWQGYTERSVPTHEEIQKHLVDIGDKPNNFIGSKQWIGSTEVGMCLTGFINVDSRILHVSSGGELSSKGSELAMHFESQGTPIMIGGGVLAHTIIGVDFNSITGDIKFLILDPHYTDVDDLNIIQGKGWCGWKGADFWDKKSYYNLCMPQRPITY